MTNATRSNSPYAGARPTRYKELGYMEQDKGLWRLVAMPTPGLDDDYAVVGPQYKTKAELMADLPRYAREYGCEGAPETREEKYREALEAALGPLARSPDGNMHYSCDNDCPHAKAYRKVKAALDYVPR